MEAILRRLLNLTSMYGPDDVEDIIVTVEVVGDKGILQDSANVAMQLEGTRHTFEDLPD